MLLLSVLLSLAASASAHNWCELTHTHSRSRCTGLTFCRTFRVNCPSRSEVRHTQIAKSICSVFEKKKQKINFF
jgi:hypothetical protein